MSTQPQRLELAIASPDEIERTARRLAALRDGFLAGESLAQGSRPAQSPRPMILHSWQRCRSMQVNPTQRQARLAISHEHQLRELREGCATLLSASRAVVHHLTDVLADSGYVVVLSDANGRLLEVLGDSGIVRRLERIDFVPGGDWSEGTAGTNAIGTALADGHVVQLMAAEHYCDGWTNLTCTAAPIRHPGSGVVLGALNITGDYRLIRPFLTGLLAAASLEITQLFALRQASPQERGGPSFWNPPLWPGQRETTRAPRLTTPDSLNRESAADIQNMRSLLHRQERRARDAERLAETTGAMSASLDMRVTLENVAEQAAHLLDLDAAAVGLFDASGTLTTLHRWSSPGSAPSRLPRMLARALRDTETSALVWERGEPVLLDASHIAALAPDAMSTEGASHTIHLLPLVAARGVIGCIAAARPRTVPWLVEDVRLGLALASQAATVIENARLFENVQQHIHHIEALNAVGGLLNTLVTPSQPLDGLVERLAAILAVDACAMLLLDGSGGEAPGVSLAAHWGVPAAGLLALRHASLGGEGPLSDVTATVATRGEPCTMQDTAAEGQVSDVLGVPLLAGSALVGVLLVWRGSIASEAVPLFTAVGQQCGLALKNAQLLRSASEMEALREADRLKSEFLATVTHDLRSPLTAIRASVDSLLDTANSLQAAEQSHLLRNIATQTGRLGKLVDQLLDLSRIEAGALTLDHEWTELPVLLDDVLAEFERLGNGHSFARVGPTDLPLLYVDPDRLVQVLWNLLDNACKYSPAGAPVTVAAQCVGTEVWIDVGDRGDGIPPTEREQIFQRFHRLSRDVRTHVQGSGLGLAICEGIVLALGGRIWVEDRPGGGSLFRVALPIPTGEPAGAETLTDRSPVGEPARDQMGGATCIQSL